MNTRVLGRTGITVSELGFGCSNLRRAAMREGKESIIRLLRTALDDGITLFDTADCYGQGFSERLIGEALSDRRDQVVLAGKAGFRFAPFPIQTAAIAARIAFQTVGSKVPPARDAMERLANAMQPQNFSPTYLERAIAKSLARLRTDYLDVFQLHNPPQALLESGECFETLKQLKRSGKVRAGGVSVLLPEQARLCLREEVDVVQLGINPLLSGVADQIPRTATEQGIGIIARQPFGSGRIWKEADRWAQQFGVTPDELASSLLRWATGQDGVSTVLVGMSTEQHLRTNIQALDAPPLPASVEEAMDRLAGISR